MIPANADLNNYRTPGNYYCNTNANAQTISNCPEQVAFTLKVIYTAGTSYIGQIFQSYQDGKAYFRRAQTTNPGDNSWTEWFPNTIGDIKEYNFTNDTYLATYVVVKKSSRIATLTYSGNLKTMPVKGGNHIVIGVLEEEYRPYKANVVVNPVTGYGRNYQVFIYPSGSVEIANFEDDTLEQTHFCRFHTSWICEK